MISVSNSVLGMMNSLGADVRENYSDRRDMDDRRPGTDLGRPVRGQSWKPGRHEQA